MEVPVLGWLGNRIGRILVVIDLTLAIDLTQPNADLLEERVCGQFWGRKCFGRTAISRLR